MTKFMLSRRADGIYTFPADPCFLAGVAGREANRIDYGLPKDEVRRRDKALLSDTLGLPLSSLFFLDQEHGDAVVEAVGPNDETAYVFAAADALVTNRPGLCLVIRTADCVPVIITDPVSRSAAAIHSGWKSTEKNISAKAARVMKDRFGASYGDMHVFILPAISAKAYRVGDDFGEKFPDATRRMGDGLHADLPLAVFQSLVREGIPAENIVTSGICTVGSNELFFSHRKGDRERNLNFVVMR